MCPLCNNHRIGDAVHTIYEDHDVGGLRGGASATRTHANANDRLSQCGGVVDAVANHERWLHPLFGCYGIDLIGRLPIGKYSIEIERSADSLGSIEPIAGNHHDAAGTSCAKRVHGAGAFAPELICKKQSTDRPAFDGNKDAKGRSPGGTAQRAHRPGLRGPRSVNQLVGTDPDMASDDARVKTGANSLSHPGGCL